MRGGAAPAKSEPKQSIPQIKPPVVVPDAKPCADPKKAAAFDKWHRPTTEVSKIVIPPKPAQETRVITYKYPDNSATTVTYNPQNVLVQIKIDGGSWKRNENGDGWTFFDEKDRAQDKMDGDLDVTERGDIIATRKDGYSETQFADGTFQIQFPDGRKEIHYPDGWCVIEDADGNRVYRNKAGIETKVAAEKKPEEKPSAKLDAAATKSGAAAAKPQSKPAVVGPPKSRPHRMTELNKKLGNVLDFNELQKQWMSYEGQEQDDGTSWFKNALGDILKQDLKDESNTIYHPDGSWEHIDKHGKVTIHLGDDWANLD